MADWELMWLSEFALIVMIFFLPETSSANILYRRSRRLLKHTGRTDLKSEPELMGEQMTTGDIAMMVLVRPFSLTFTELIFFLLNIYIAYLRAAVHLVRVLLYRLRENLRLQSRVGRPCLPRHLDRCLRRPAFLFHLAVLCTGAAVQ